MEAVQFERIIVWIIQCVPFRWTAVQTEVANTSLAAVNEKLRKASDMKDTFLANMSHELRTPLNAILGVSQALQLDVYGKLSDEQRTSLTTIDTSGAHLLSLINDILDLSRLEAGHLKLRMQPVDLTEVCDDALTLVRPQARAKKLKLSSSSDGGPDRVWGDSRLG